MCTSNISSPGWAKHAWSSFFGPWNAEATILVLNQPRFDAAGLLRVLGTCGVTTFCGPPTVWRMLVQADLGAATTIREAVSAGEPLNPEVIERVRAAWGVTIRDGYGQTETTLQIGNTPGMAVVPGSMGRPLPGYTIRLLDVNGAEVEEGEIAIDLSPAPTGLMQGYVDESGTLRAPRGAAYRTGDVALRSADGSLIYVGRSDDVFKSSGYRISPFELESVLVEHEVVAEAGGGAVARPGADVVAEGVHRAGRGGRAGCGDGGGDLCACPGAVGAVQTDLANRVLRVAEDDLGEDPAGGSAPVGGGPTAGGCDGGGRVCR